MTLVKLGISIGVLAGIWTYISASFNIATWPAFVGWALFFASGGDAKSIYKAALPAISGTILGWIAIQIMPFLGGGTIGLSIAVVIVAFIMTVMGLIPGFEFVPGQFASAAAFFGMGATTAAMGTNLLPLLLGVGFGYVSAILPDLFAPKQQEERKAKAN